MGLPLQRPCAAALAGARCTAHLPLAPRRRCRHCPYGHVGVTSARTPRVNRITRPILLSRCDHAAPLAAHARDVVLLGVAAGEGQAAVAARVEQLRAASSSSSSNLGASSSASGCSACIGMPGQLHVVAVVAVDPCSRACWQLDHGTCGGAGGSAGAAGPGGLDGVMGCCRGLGLPLVAVPVGPGAQGGTGGAEACARLVMTQAAEVVRAKQRAHVLQHLQLQPEGEQPGQQQEEAETRVAWVQDACVRPLQQPLPERLPCLTWLECCAE